VINVPSSLSSERRQRMKNRLITRPPPIEGKQNPLSEENQYYKRLANITAKKAIKRLNKNLKKSKPGRWR
jgi:hypothetical protein